MNYESMGLIDVYDLVSKRYTEEKMQSIADDFVYDLVGRYDYEELHSEDDEYPFDAMNYLAQYFSKGEYKEWLINNFLVD